MTASHFIGIDSSTTATKALVMDASGAIVAVGRSDYGFDTPRPLWSEQSPDLWWRATIEAIGRGLTEAGITGADVGGVGLTGQMHGLVLLDADDTVLRPAILWNDQRTQDECDEIRNRFGRDELIAATGNDALTGFTAPKILWVRNHEPEVFSQVAHVLLPKDFVRLKLTGEHAIDKAGGSGTILFDLARRNWSAPLLDALGLPASWFPGTFEGTAVTGAITPEAAAATGLATGTPVFGGGGDQAANGVGVGAVRSGTVAMSVGTSGVVFAAVDRPVIEPEGRLHAFCHAVPDRWHLMGVMLSAAGSYEWFHSAFAPDSSYEELDAAAASAPPGSAGLVFLPYLSGERTPHPDPLARGVFAGLTVRHGMGHLARSVMEGVAFGLRDSLELIGDAVEIGDIRVSGGGASSSVWLQIISDVIGRPLRVVGTAEAAAHGAAMLAATGAGAFTSVDEATTAAVELGQTYEPGPGSSAAAEAYDVFRSLYPTLRGTFPALAELETSP